MATGHEEHSIVPPHTSTTYVHCTCAHGHQVSCQSEAHLFASISFLHFRQSGKEVPKFAKPSKPHRDLHRRGPQHQRRSEDGWWPHQKHHAQHKGTEQRLDAKLHCWWHAIFHSRGEKTIEHGSRRERLEAIWLHVDTH